MFRGHCRYVDSKMMVMLKIALKLESLTVRIFDEMMSVRRPLP